MMGFLLLVLGFVTPDMDAAAGVADWSDEARKVFEGFVDCKVHTDSELRTCTSPFLHPSLNKRMRLSYELLFFTEAVIDGPKPCSKERAEFLSSLGPRFSKHFLCVDVESSQRSSKGAIFFTKHKERWLIRKLKFF